MNKLNQRSPVVPCGIPFLDRFLDGGMLPGETYGILGPTGVGKTMLAVQIAVEAARRAAEAAPDQLSYLFSFETDKADLQIRTMCYAARIHQQSFCESAGQFSRRGALRPYEKQLFAKDIADGRDPPGEKERLEQVLPWIKRHLRLVDCTGTGKATRGPIPYMLDHLDKELPGSGCRPGCICIDHVDAACRGHLLAGPPGSLLQLPHMIGSFAEECRHRLAEQYDCPVWLVHFLKGTVAQRSPAAVLHHSMTLHGPRFANGLTYAFVMGEKDRESHCCMMRCTKARRSLEGIDPVILFIDGALGRLVDANDRHLIEIPGYRIVPIDNHCQVDADAATLADLEESMGTGAVAQRMPRARNSARQSSARPFRSRSNGDGGTSRK